eukprot:SAG11_NODE_20673_length_440_cov_2.354839_1_plen_34_part_10
MRARELARAISWRGPDEPGGRERGRERERERERE